MTTLTKQALELELQTRKKALLESMKNKKGKSSATTTPTLSSTNLASLYQDQDQQDISSVLYEAVVDLQSLGYSFNMIIEESGINRSLLEDCFKRWNFPIQPDCNPTPATKSITPISSTPTPITSTITSRNGNKIKTNAFAVLDNTTGAAAAAAVTTVNQPHPTQTVSRSPSISNLTPYSNNTNNRARFNNKVFQTGSTERVERPDWMDDLVLNFETTDDEEETSEDEKVEEEDIIIIEDNNAAASTTRQPTLEENHEFLKGKMKSISEGIEKLSNFVKSNDIKRLDDQIDSLSSMIQKAQVEKEYLLSKIKTLDVVIKKDSERLIGLREEIKPLHLAKTQLANLLIEQDEIERELSVNKRSTTNKNYNKKKKRRSSSVTKSISVESTQQTSITMHEALRQRLLNIKRKKEQEQNHNSEDLCSTSLNPSKRVQTVKIQISSDETATNLSVPDIIEITDDDDDDDDSLEEIMDPCPPLKAKERPINTNNYQDIKEQTDEDENSTSSPNSSKDEDLKSAIYGETIHKIEKAKSSKFKPYVSYGLKSNKAEDMDDKLKEGHTDQLCPLELINGTCVEKDCKFQHLS